MLNREMVKRVMRATCLGVVPLWGMVAHGQVPNRPSPPPRVPAADYPSPTPFPNQLDHEVAVHLSKARRYAGTDLFQEMAHRCVIGALFRPRVDNAQYDGKMVPSRIFDNFYSIGQNAVMSYALKTSGGIIVFDALNGEDEVKALLVPNMIALGLKPEDIKYVVVTHGHGDHYGGARYLQKTYGARVVASAIDWKLMADASSRPGPFRDLTPPDHDIDMPDGGSIKLGDTVVNFYITPGHTQGVLSSIFKVTDRGVPHVVGFHGGTGGGQTIPTTRAQIASLPRWGEIARRAGVDVNITNHSIHSEAIEKQELLRYRLPGDSNPFVIGRDAYQRYVQVLRECSYVTLARLGQAN